MKWRALREKKTAIPFNRKDTIKKNQTITFVRNTYRICPLHPRHQLTALSTTCASILLQVSMNTMAQMTRVRKYRMMMELEVGVSTNLICQKLNIIVQVIA